MRFRPEEIDPVEFYTTAPYVVFDVETTNLMKGDGREKNNRIILSVTLPHRGNIWTMEGNEFQQRQLVQMIERCGGFTIGHNLKFDLRWASRCGLDLKNPNLRIWDTQIAEYVLAGNRKMPLSLDACLARRGMRGKDQLVNKLIKSGVCPSTIPKRLLEKYARTDVLQTYALFLDQLQEALALNLVPVIYTRCLVTVPLTDIEEQGMYVDPKALKKVIDEAILEYQKYHTILERDYGGVNFNSGPQVRKLLYEDLKFAPALKNGKPMLTPKGALSTAEPVFHMLKAKTRKQRDFLDNLMAFRKVSSKLSKYLTKLDECVKEDGGHLLANFNQTVTVTHRLSSTGYKHGIQFQNMDRNLKPLFWSGKEGWPIGEADMSGLEFRIAAALTGDRQAIQDIVEKRDVHSTTRDIITSYGQLMDRQEAKEHTFKPLYAGQSGTEAEKEYYAYFRDRYKQMAATQKQWSETALVDKRLVTPWGLIFYFPHARRTSTGYIEGCTNHYNYPIQSFATADIVLIGLAYFWHKINELGLEMRIVNTVHDSVVAIFPEKERELFETLAVECMVEAPIRYIKSIYGIELGVPLEVEIKCSRNWNGEEQ